MWVVEVAKIVIFIFGLALIGFALNLVYLGLRYPTLRSTRMDVITATGLIACRLGAGVAAIWTSFGGGFTTGWAMIGLLVSGEAWREIMRRRYKSESPDESAP